MNKKERILSIIEELRHLLNVLVDELEYEGELLEDDSYPLDLVIDKG
jgi:hypothetical protein